MTTSPTTFYSGPIITASDFPTFRKFFVSAHDHFIPHHRNNYHPHILSHRMLALLSMLLLTVKISAIALVAVGPVVTVEASSITSSTVISLANEARAQEGLAALTANSSLARAAQTKANDMLAKQYFSHNTPSGDTPWTFIKAVGYNYITAGENLAIHFTDAETMQTAWMNSPGHRANIMNKSFQEIGIGISQGMFDGHETTIVVQMFGTPIAQKVSLPSTPTPVQQPTPPVVAPVVAPAPAPAHVAPAPVAAAPVPVAAPARPVIPTKSVAPTAPAPVAAPTPTTISPRSETLANPLTGPIATQPIEIKSTQTSLQGNQLYVTATASNDATKLLAVYGNKSVMLDPSGNNEWYGYIPLANLGENSNLLVYAYDIKGNLTQVRVTEFTKSINPATSDGKVEGASISVIGKIVNPKVWEQKIILMILASLIACLILAIAIRRHVQHVGLIANTAFVAMLAAFMLMV